MIYIFLSLILYTCAIMVGAIASRNANTNIVTAITNLVSTVIPVIAAIPFFTNKTLQNSKFGLIMAVVGGICIALFTLALNKSFSVNKVAIVSPIVFGGAIFLTAVLSAIFFKEKITSMQGLGLAALAIGFILIIYAGLTGK